MTEPGNGPPKGEAPSELWAAMMAIPLPHEVVDFPFKDPILGESIGKVAMVPLAPEDLMICKKLAGDWAKKMTGESPKEGEESPAYRQIFGDEASVQILWRAMRDVNDKTLEKPAFPAPGIIRRKPFSGDIIAVLLRQYMRVSATKGPIIATMTEPEINAWLDVLEEGGSAVPLAFLSSETTSDLLMHSVARSKQLRTASGSHGQPQDAGPIAPKSDEPKPSADAEEPPIEEADVPAIPEIT